MKLPLNCHAEYLQDFLEKNEANELFQELFELVKPLDYKFKTFSGEVVETDFKKIIFLEKELKNQNAFPFEFWGNSMEKTESLYSLTKKIESYVGQYFEVCVLVFYPNGNSGVDFHSDFSAFGDTTTLPSISLGEEREFQLRNKESYETYSKVLRHGSMIIMGENCQNNYEHSLPINPSYSNPRINLTFRRYGF
jgi:alkylated DNA repair dioxygenase AlkB